MGIIDAGIAFIVAYLLFMLGRWLVLPHMRVGLPALEPAWLWTSVYGVVLYAANFLFNFIIIFLAIVYVVWLFIKKFVPAFPPFRQMLLALPPFKPLEQAGVLPFIHTIVTTLFSRMAVRPKFLKMFHATGTFFYNGTRFLAKLGIQRNVARAQRAVRKGHGKKGPKTDVPYDTPAEQQADREDELSADEKVRMLEDEQMCLAETLLPVRPDMTALEKAAVLVKNQTAASVCKARQMLLYSKIMGDRGWGKKRKRGKK